MDGKIVHQAHCPKKKAGFLQRLDGYAFVVESQTGSIIKVCFACSKPRE